MPSINRVIAIAKTPSEKASSRCLLNVIPFLEPGRQSGGRTYGTQAAPFQATARHTAARGSPVELKLFRHMQLSITGIRTMIG